MFLLLHQLHYTDSAAMWTAASVALVICVLVAWLAYYLVEQPSIRVSALFARRVMSPFAPPVPAGPPKPAQTAATQPHA